RPTAAWVRKKLAMRGGETDRAISIHESPLQDLGLRIGLALGHLGNLDCDILLTPRGPFILDLNPRFRGGYPFSHAARANLPAILLAWAQERAPDPTWFKVQAGVSIAKCDRLVVLDPE